MIREHGACSTVRGGGGLKVCARLCIWHSGGECTHEPSTHTECHGNHSRPKSQKTGDVLSGNKRSDPAAGSSGLVRDWQDSAGGGVR